MSPNIEDRRNEFTELEHLMMQLGLMPMPEQDAEARRQLGLKPGEWLDASDPNVMPPTSVLSLDAGANDLDNMARMPHIAQGKTMLPKGRR